MRRNDWAAKMYETIAAHNDLEFEWGVNDCCLFSARVIDAMCGTDHEKTLKTKYTDEPSALAYIASEGGLDKAVSSFLGPALEGRPSRGDAVLVNVNKRELIGICVGKEIAIKSTHGIDYAPRSLIKAFWRI